MTMFYLPSRIQASTILPEDVKEVSHVKLQTINTHTVNFGIYTC